MLGGAYLYFSHDLSSTEILPVAYGSSLVSSTGVEQTDNIVTQSDKISSDVAFLTTLASLKRIKIDTSIFQNKSFTSLKDNTVKIEKVSAGRINPFAPMGVSFPVNAGLPKVVTDQPTQITDKTVVFNGTINESGARDTYFEYGTTLELGTVTPMVKQSLVGTFIKNVLGLTPKTNYFYKACAKINGSSLCGDVVSFTTN